MGATIGGRRRVGNGKLGGGGSLFESVFGESCKPLLLVVVLVLVLVLSGFLDYGDEDENEPSPGSSKHALGVFVGGTAVCGEPFGGGSILQRIVAQCLAKLNVRALMEEL